MSRDTYFGGDYFLFIVRLFLFINGIFLSINGARSGLIRAASTKTNKSLFYKEISETRLSPPLLPVEAGAFFRGELLMFREFLWKERSIAASRMIFREFR